MFTDKILERIFEQKETHEVPLKYQSIMIHAIEKVLEENSNADEL